MLERISIPGTPAPQGPYSPAVRAGDFIYVSGQGAVDPSSNTFSFGDIEHETQLTLSNIQRILEGCGSSLADVIKCSVFLADAGHFAAMNKVYATFWKANAYPARTTVQAAFAEPRMKIEIDCVAYSPKPKA